MREHESREPFAYIIQDKYERERGVEGHLSRSHVSKYVSQEDINEHEITCTPLYRHAQPAQVVPDFETVLESLDHDVRCNIRESEHVYQASKATYDACRAAMLAAADCSIPMISDRWIPVSERMPEDRMSVILWDAEIGEVTSGHYSHKTQTFYHCGDAIGNEITHWMPLPAAPQKVK